MGWKVSDEKKLERLIELAIRNNKINLRLIGPNISEKLSSYQSDRIELFDEVYDKELYTHFKWSNIIFNPGGAGLLVMNAARFSRPIVIDKFSHHGPEIQLAIDSNQDFVDFRNKVEVDDLIDLYISNNKYLLGKGSSLYNEMKNYTIEYMTKQYLKAIEKI